jgi:MFS family permease
LVVGYALLTRRAGRFAPIALLIGGFAVSSAGNLLTGLAWSVAAAFVLQTVRGIGLSAIDVGVNTFLQRRVSPELLGRVFGNLYGAIGIAAAVSYLLGAVLLVLTDPRITFLIAGGGGLLITVATLAATTRARRRSAADDRPQAGQEWGPGSYDLADRWLGEAVAWCTDRDLDPLRSYGLAWQAHCYFEQGRWVEATATATTVLGALARHVPSQIVALAVLGRLRTRRGDPDAHEPLDRAFGSSQRHPGQSSSRSDLRWLRPESGCWCCNGSPAR